MNKIRYLLIGLIVATSFPAYAESWDLTQLMTGLAQVQSDESRFTEKKTIALLKNPAESSGILSYRRPDHVEKHVLQPNDESIIVDGSELTWKDNASGKTHTLRVQSDAALAAFVESIRATLAGDLPALQRYFEIKLDGVQAHWTMTLTPTADAMKHKVQVMRIEGAGKQVNLIEVQETDGDRSILAIQHD